MELRNSPIWSMLSMADVQQIIDSTSPRSGTSLSLFRSLCDSIAAGEDNPHHTLGDTLARTIEPRETANFFMVAGFHIAALSRARADKQAETIAVEAAKAFLVLNEEKFTPQVNWMLDAATGHRCAAKIAKALTAKGTEKLAVMLGRAMDLRVKLVKAGANDVSSAREVNEKYVIYVPGEHGRHKVVDKGHLPDDDIEKLQSLFTVSE